MCAVFVGMMAAPALATEGVVATAVDASGPFSNSRRVDVHGVALHVRDWHAAAEAAASGASRASRSSTPCPVLLVHALAGSTYSFRHLAPALAAGGHRVLAVDLPGYGYSERRPFDGSASAALWALLERESPGARWCLVGHSMGARVVGQMVAEAPSRAASAAYLSGSPIRERKRNPSMFRAQPLRGMVLALAERRYLRADGLADALEEGLGRAPQPDELAAYLAPLREPGTLPAILDGYARDMGPDRTDPAAMGEVPSLVLWGARDRWLKPEVGEALAQALPGARWVQVDDAAHSPMETHPEAVLPPLLAWFDAAGAAASTATNAAPPARHARTAQTAVSRAASATSPP